MWPTVETDDVLTGFYTEGDGCANPVDVGVSPVRGAERAQIQIIENVEFTGVTQKYQSRRCPMSTSPISNFRLEMATGIRATTSTTRRGHLAA